MKTVYKMRGTCANALELEIEDGIVKEVRFSRGCDGNLQGIAALVSGMDANEVVRRLRGIKCGYKNTSCPDQLSRAIEEYLESGEDRE